jgi:hypothetical protein
MIPLNEEPHFTFRFAELETPPFARNGGFASVELWRRVQQECPGRVLTALHRSGEYPHGVTSRFSGKVLCCHQDEPLPDGWAPTPAQEQASRRAAEVDITDGHAA